MPAAVQILYAGVIRPFMGDKEGGFDGTSIGVLPILAQKTLVDAVGPLVDGVLEGNDNHLRHIFRIDAVGDIGATAATCGGCAGAAVAGSGWADLQFGPAGGRSLGYKHTACYLTPTISI